MQEQALEIGSKEAWKWKFTVSGAVVGFLAPAIASVGAAGAILVGGATVVVSVIDFIETVKIIQNETGFTSCTVARLMLDLFGAISGGLLIRKGYIQFKETGKWFKWQGNRNPIDIQRQNEYPNPPPANEDGIIGLNTNQNQDVAYWVRILKRLGASDIRVNQEQVNLDGIRVGQNRPDLQFTLNGKRFYIEWDTSSSLRGLIHADRILANDSSVSGILEIDGNSILYITSEIVNNVINGNNQIILITMD
jgi:hypothetical protein